MIEIGMQRQKRVARIEDCSGLGDGDEAERGEKEREMSSRGGRSTLQCQCRCRCKCRVEVCRISKRHLDVAARLGLAG